LPCTGSRRFGLFFLPCNPRPFTSIFAVSLSGLFSDLCPVVTVVPCRLIVLSPSLPLEPLIPFHCLRILLRITRVSTFSIYIPVPGILASVAALTQVPVLRFFPGRRRVLRVRLSPTVFSLVLAALDDDRGPFLFSNNSDSIMFSERNAQESAVLFCSSSLYFLSLTLF